MKAFLILIAIFLSQITFGQWTDDPNNPMIISNAPGQQRYTKVLEDGNGGWFLIWKDARVNETEFDLYGQHLDENGYALFLRTDIGTDLI